jgi:hypothetical protein
MFLPFVFAQEREARSLTVGGSLFAHHAQMVGALKERTIDCKR